MGPATGFMTKWLSGEMRCKVTCIEVDADAAKLAEPFCGQMIVADLERDNWQESIAEQAYDYIIFADVLEHLRDPLAVLKRAISKLAPGGEILISIPNIAYAGVIGELLEGRFDYRRDGLLDETHVRFFTRRSLEKLLSEAGLKGLNWSRTVVAPQHSEFKFKASRWGSALRNALASMPDGDTYQFLVRCGQGGGLQAAESVAQSVDLTQHLSFQLFFDRGNGFSEAESELVFLGEGPGWQHITMSIPDGVRAIRIDPVDAQRIVAFRELAIQIDGNVKWAWSPADGELSSFARLERISQISTSGGALLIPHDDDPSLYIQIDSPQGGEFEAYLALEDGSELVKLIAELRLTERRSAQIISDREQAIVELNGEIGALKDDLIAARAERDDLMSRLDRADIERANLVTTLNSIVSSRSWRVTKPFRVAVRLCRALYNLPKRHARLILRGMLLRAPRLLRFRPVATCARASGLFNAYEITYLRREPTSADLAEFRRAADKDGARVKFSILMPTYRTNPAWLKSTVESVLSQSYPNWELCVVDDASDSPALRSLLDTYAHNDTRIKVSYLKQNRHISHASNNALEMASGDYVVLLDHDDLLAPQALSRLAALIESDPGADVIYSDEDKVDSSGRRYEPTFKPSWSADYFLSFMFTGHISCFRAELIRAVGGFREGLEGSQDYDMMLRVTERTDRIRHVPEILYHWRAHGESVAGNPNSKPYAYKAAERALTEALHRRGFSDAVVRDSSSRGLYLLERGKRASCAGVCLFGGAVVDEWADGATIQRIQCADNKDGIGSLLAEVAQSTGEVFVLAATGHCLRADLERLLDQASDPGIGVLAPALVDRNQRVLSAGISIVDEEMAHNFHGLAADAIGYRGRLRVPFNVSSVAPVLCIVRRELLKAIPRDLQGDIGSLSELVYCLCLVALNGGKRVVLDPSVRLQVEMREDEGLISRAKMIEMRRAVGIEGARDPFFPEGLIGYTQSSRMPEV
jgi:glycosyltransferase involved in cell wall biosynthesis